MNSRKVEALHRFGVGKLGGKGVGVGQSVEVRSVLLTSQRGKGDGAGWVGWWVVSRGEGRVV